MGEAGRHAQEDSLAAQQQNMEAKAAAAPPTTTAAAPKVGCRHSVSIVLSNLWKVLNTLCAAQELSED